MGPRSSSKRSGDWDSLRCPRGSHDIAKRKSPMCLISSLAIHSGIIKKKYMHAFFMWFSFWVAMARPGSVSNAWSNIKLTLSSPLWLLDPFLGGVDYTHVKWALETSESSWDLGFMVVGWTEAGLSLCLCLLKIRLTSMRLVPCSPSTVFYWTKSTRNGLRDVD